ncbi:iron-siderophore ABC transporter substrate-binding protein [Pseudonocardia xishanensis]|uniref:Iron-siderophore ABC transporter substrate-binding protein n=1 Tax=Pseudonocardia xishanensis TaxID=630995 RepID=A0ABP8RMX9_9PSEU
MAAVTAAVGLTLAACGQVQDSSSPGGTAAAATTVETLFGAVEVPANPQRVVALGWSDAEAALALGVQPIAVSDWLAFGGKGVGPWAADLFTSTPTILPTLELNYEQISALNPDLILNTRSDNTKEKFDELSRIAPTVSAPPGVTVQYGTTWEQQATQVAAALGRKEQGAALVADVNGAFAAAKAADPGFAGRTVGVGAFFSDSYGAYVQGDPRVDFLESLGFTNAPQIKSQAAGGSFYVSLARENIEQLSADLTILFPIGGDASPLKTDPVLNQIPAARAGHLLILEDPTLINAFSSGSTPGTRYAIDHAVPLIAATI